MAKLSKRVQALRAKVDRNQAYPVTDALRLAQYDGDFTYETHNFTAKMPDEVIMSGLKHSIDIGNLLIDMIQGGHQA